MAEYSSEAAEISLREDAGLSPDPQKYQSSPATLSEQSDQGSQVYTSVLHPSEEGEGGLRERIPAASVTLEEAKRIQEEYEAPFSDLINQNPIKTRDFKHPPSWFQDAPFSHNLRLAVGMVPALFVVVSLSGKGLLATLSIGALFTYFILNFSLPKHALLSCLLSIIAAEVL